MKSLFITLFICILFEGYVFAQKCTQSLSGLEKIMGASNDDKEDEIFAQGYELESQSEISGHSVGCTQNVGMKYGMNYGFFWI